MWAPVLPNMLSNMPKPASGRRSSRDAFFHDWNDASLSVQQMNKKVTFRFRNTAYTQSPGPRPETVGRAALVNF